MGHGTGRRQRALGRPVAVGMHSAEFPEARSSPGRMAPVIRGVAPRRQKVLRILFVPDARDVEVHDRGHDGHRPCPKTSAVG
jgi:hypothetical protein